MINSNSALSQLVSVFDRKLNKNRVNNSQETIDVLLHLVILRYVKMGGCQYLRDYWMALRLKKTAELRKRVLQRNKKNAQKNDSVPYQVRKYVQREYRELTDNKRVCYSYT